MALDTAVAHEPVPATYVIMGREVRLPVEVRDATAAVAYYLVSSSAVQRLLDPAGLRAASVFPGRTLMTIGAMDYKDGDLGTYHEIGVTFFVHGRDARPLPLIGTLVGFLRGGVDAYIHRLPVDGEFTREAGCSIWGFPKFMTEIDLTNDGDTQTAVLRADGVEVLRQSVDTGGTRSFDARDQISYAFRDGVLYRTPSVMSGGEIRAAFRGGSIELGSHPLADELRSLGLPKRPIFTTYIGKMTATFGAAERFDAPPGRELE